MCWLTSRTWHCLFLNEDPLVFYDAIARFAKEKLRPGGSIFVEIHEDLGAQNQGIV